jgi:gluconolactonase
MTETLYVSQWFTPPDGFTAGIEGPACDSQGNVYAVNYAHEGTIGQVGPDGQCRVFVTLPQGSVGNGIRFHSDGSMLIADYTGHNVLRVDMPTRAIAVYAHDERLNQPNDICITKNDLVFASDPNWARGDGRLWRVRAGAFELLEDEMGTTNGIEVGPDEHTLYVNETTARRIWAYDLSDRGEISNKRLFHQFEEFLLDGMRCDAAGNLLVTRFGGGRVAMLSPTGELVREIALRGKNCTNLTFGGPDGRTVYVTLADVGNLERFRVEIPGR